MSESAGSQDWVAMMALAHTLCPMEGTCIYPSGWPLAGRNPHERENAKSLNCGRLPRQTHPSAPLPAPSMHLQTDRFFADRKARADFKAFDKIMRRRGGKPPGEGDEAPL